MLYINSMEFPEEQTDKFFIGSEDYNIYQANAHQSQHNVGQS